MKSLETLELINGLQKIISNSLNQPLHPDYTDRYHQLINDIIELTMKVNK
jgi:hypothetical protein